MGRFALLTDMALFVAVYAAVIGFALRERTRGRKALAIFLGAILLGATLGLTRIEVNSVHIENHRFATICEVVFGIMAVVLFTRLPPGAWERVRWLGPWRSRC